MPSTPQSRHRARIMFLGFVALMLALTVMIFHIVSFMAVEKSVKNEFLASALGRAKAARFWAKERGFLAPGREGDLFAKLPQIEDQFQFMEIGWTTYGEVLPTLNIVQRERLMEGAEIARYSEADKLIVCYLPADERRILKISFSGKTLHGLENALWRLNAFEGTALAVMLFLSIALLFWYGAPFSKMLAIAGERDGSLALSSDERRYLVSTFETAITELKKRARSFERLSDEIARGITNGVVTIDASGKIIKANQSALDILGLRGNPEERNFKDIFSQPVGQLAEKCLVGRKPSLSSEIVYPATGKTLAVSVSPMYDAGEEFLGVLCIFTDLTKIKHLEESLRLKESLAHLGEMTAGIAHEFRNALASILSFSQLIASKAQDAQLKSYASDIVREVKDAQRVVTDFLKFARPMEIQKESVNISAILKELISESKSSGVEIVLRGAESFATGDPSLIKQAFSNILRNAIEATENNAGERKVSISVGEPALSGEDEDFVKIVFEDNGAGMSAEAKQKAFSPFFTTKEKGLGFGLAIVQKIILSHNGEVRAESEAGRGTAVKVFLPKAER